jgi:polyether ionophore transport system permease protein
MFRSIFTKTLRDWRLAILLWGFGLALIVCAYFPLSASTIVKGNPEEVQRLAESQRFFAEPVAITTPEGYVTWKVIASLPLILGIWAARAGARLGRFAEERGTLDIVLSTPQSRGRVLGEGIAALVTATILIGVLIGVGALIGEVLADVTVDPVGALLTGVNVSLMSLAFGTLALLMAQFLTSAGAATGFACAVMVVAWILDGTGRISPDLAWVGRLSPYHLFTLSKPLIASYGTNYGALIALVALAAIFGAVSIPLFARRDLGASAWPRRGTARRESGETVLARAMGDISLRGVGLRTLRSSTPALVWWLIGLAIFLVWMAGITKAIKDTLIDLLTNFPRFRDLLGGSAFSSDAGIVSGILFAFLPILVAFFALTMASSWARDLETGRLEMVLATPVPRWRVYLEAWGATLAALIFAPLILCVILLVALQIIGLQVSTSHMIAAFVGFLPIELLTAAIVFLAAGRFSAGTINGGDSGLLAASFIGEFLNPVLHLPGWLIGLSIFHHYGTPLVSGPSWAAWGVISLLSLVLVGIGLVQFTRSDLQRAA